MYSGLTQFWTFWVKWFQDKQISDKEWREFILKHLNPFSGDGWSSSVLTTRWNEVIEIWELLVFHISMQFLMFGASSWWVEESSGLLPFPWSPGLWCSCDKRQSPQLKDKIYGTTCTKCLTKNCMKMGKKWQIWGKRKYKTNIKTLSLK